jgi:hypothetical protein
MSPFSYPAEYYPEQVALLVVKLKTDTYEVTKEMNFFLWIERNPLDFDDL